MDFPLKILLEIVPPFFGSEFSEMYAFFLISLKKTCTNFRQKKSVYSYNLLKRIVVLFWIFLFLDLPHDNQRS